MVRGSLTGGVLAFAALLGAADAQGVRDFTRPKPGTTSPLTEAQATEVTLTLTDVQFRPIQTWVRAAGKPDGNIVTLRIKGAQASLVQPGQRLRAFSVLSRAQMMQGRVTRVSKTEDGVAVQAELARPLFGDPATCVVEIVTEAGPYLSIPNVSIIDEGEEEVVYLKGEGGGYNRRAIKTGIQGELYTQVIEGLAENDEVVSVGSFFVDADTKLKSTGGMPPMPGMDHGSMAGMDHGAMQTVQATPKDVAAAGPLKLVMTDPEASSTVGSPMMIHVRFNRPVDAAKSKIDITDAKGARVASGDPEPMSRDGTMLMVMPDARLAPGDYKVKWRTTATDKSVLEGAFSFKVQ
jgi:copper resistance protein C